MSACFPSHLHWYHLPFILFDSTRPPPTSRTQYVPISTPLCCPVKLNEMLSLFPFFAVFVNSPVSSKHVWFIQQLLVLSWFSVLNTSTSSISYAVRRTASAPSTIRSFYRNVCVVVVHRARSIVVPKPESCVAFFFPSIHIDITHPESVFDFTLFLFFLHAVSFFPLLYTSFTCNLVFQTVFHYRHFRHPLSGPMVSSGRTGNSFAIPRHSTSRCCHTALISPLHTFRHFYKVGKVGNHQ